MRNNSMGAIIIICALAVAARPAGAQFNSNAPRSPELFQHIAKGESQEAQAMLEKDPGLLKAQDGISAEPLGAAVRAGLADLVKFCLEKGADVNHRTNDRETPLGQAVWDGKKEIVALLLEKNPELNEVCGPPGFMRGTPLYRAAYNGNVVIAKMLLAKGADVNAGEGGGVTALSAAVTHKSPETVLLLLERGAKPNTRNELGGTPLLSAYRWGDAEIIAALKKAGAKLTVTDAITVKDYDALAALLVDKPELANALDGAGRTPLLVAVSLKDRKAVEMLLDKGADPNAKSSGDRTTMGAAIQSGDQAILALLTGKGGKLAAGPDASAALLDAGLSGNVAAIKTLLDKGADVNFRNKRGETPLYQAAYFGHLAAVQLLLDHNADVQPAEKDGKAPLFGAAAQGQVAIIKLLVQHGADVNYKCYGQTAIFEAILNGRVEAVKTLIALKADVNVYPPGDGRTPLILACCAFQDDPPKVAIVKLLLAAGADLYVKDKSDQTAASRAKEGLNPQISRLLDEAAKAHPAPANVAAAETLLGYKVTNLTLGTWDQGGIWQSAVDGDRLYCVMGTNAGSKVMLHVGAFRLPDGAPLGRVAFFTGSPHKEDTIGDIVPAGDKVYVATEFGLLECASDGKTRLIGEAEGLVGTKLDALAWYDGKLYMGLGYPGGAGKGGFANYDPAAGKGVLLALSVATDKPSTGHAAVYFVRAILADPKRKCLWLSVGDVMGYELSGIWRYDPASGKSEVAAREAPDSDGYSMRWCDDHILYHTYGGLVLVNPDTLSKTWLMDAVVPHNAGRPEGITGLPLISDYGLSSPWPAFYDGECLLIADDSILHLVTPGKKPSDYRGGTNRIVGLHRTPYGILVVEGNGKAFFLTKKEAEK